MPPLFKKKPFEGKTVVPSQMTMEKPKSKFKTPLLTKANLSKFLRHDDTVNKTVLDNSDSQISHKSSEILAGNDSQNKNSESQGDNTTASQSILNLSSSSKMSMNDPTVKEAYLNYLESDTNEKSSSQYSMNDPVVKLQYLEFLEDIQEKQNVESVNQNTHVHLQKHKKIEKLAKKQKHNVTIKKNSSENKSKLTDEHSKSQKPKNRVNKTINKENSRPKIRDTKFKEDKKNDKTEFKGFPTPKKGKVTYDKNKYYYKRDQFKGSKNKNNLKDNITKNKVERILENNDHVFPTYKEQLESSLESRNVGLYVFCDRCDQIRYLAEVKDPLELPHKWFCENNPDLTQNSCLIPGVIIPEEEDAKLIENTFNAGSIVWAHLEGFPWWPAMVDDCPETEDYFWIDELDLKQPSYYHVTYFDTKSVTRSWVRIKDILPFSKYSNPNKQKGTLIGKSLNNRLNKSIDMAKEACRLRLIDRLRKYSFVYRYNKKIDYPKVSGEKLHQAFKKYGVEIPRKAISKDKRKLKQKKQNEGEKKESTYLRIKSVNDESIDTDISAILDFDMGCNGEEVSIEDIFGEL